jgi:hypothetical protein
MLRGSEELTRSVLLCFAVPRTIYPWPYDGPFFSTTRIIAILTFPTNTESLSRPLSKHQPEQKNPLPTILPYPDPISNPDFPRLSVSFILCFDSHLRWSPLSRKRSSRIAECISSRGRGTGEEGFYWARGLMSVGEDEGVPFLLSVDEQENRRAMRLLPDGIELEKRLVLL